MDRRARLNLAAAAAGLGLILSVAALAVFPRHFESSASYLGLAAAAAASFLGVVALLRQPEAERCWLLRPPGMLAAALLLRLVPLLSTPWSSDDVHRYLWEGRVQRAGYSPYTTPPDDPVLAPLRDDNWRDVAHKEVPAVYPPLSQALFRLFPGGLLGWKLLVCAVDLGVLLLLLHVLRRRGRGPDAALYGLHPLIALEFAGSGHLDAIAIGLGVAAVALIVRRREFWAALLAAAAILVKPPAAAVLASWIGRRRLLPLALCGGVVVIGLRPMLSEGAAAREGLETYGQHWEFNGLGFPLLRAGLREYKERLEALPSTPAHRDLLEFGWRLQPNRDARRLAGLLFGLLAAAVILRRRHDPLGATEGVLLAFLLTTPTVYPWYVAALVPCLPFTQRPALLALSLGSLACGVVKVAELRTGSWAEPGWLGPLTWGLPIGIGWWSWWRARRRGRAPTISRRPPEPSAP